MNRHLKSVWYIIVIFVVFNRLGVAWAVLQSPPSLINSIIHSFIHPFVKIYSKHSQSQTGRARELKFWENVHPTICVMCLVSYLTCYGSHVMCHLSYVTCYMSNFFFTFFLIKKKSQKNHKKMGQCGEASRWKVSYQRGLPYLVYVVRILYS